MKAYDGLADYYKKVQPGVLAFTVAKDPNHPEQIHALQIYADDEAFKRATDTTNPAISYGFGGIMSNIDLNRPQIK